MNCALTYTIVAPRVLTVSMGTQTGLFLGFNAVHPLSQANMSDRASVQELLSTLLDSVEPFYTPNNARVRCPGGTPVRFGKTAADIEGISAPRWELACLLGNCGDYHGTEWWVEGLKTGTDPENPE